MECGNVQSTAGNPLIVGDSLYFYVSGRYNSKPVHDSNFTTGLAASYVVTALYPCKPEPKGHFITDAVTVNGNWLRFLSFVFIRFH